MRNDVAQQSGESARALAIPTARGDKEDDEGAARADGPPPQARADNCSNDKEAPRAGAPKEVLQGMRYLWCELPNFTPILVQLLLEPGETPQDGGAGDVQAGARPKQRTRTGDPLKCQALRTGILLPASVPHT